MTLTLEQAFRVASGETRSAVSPGPQLSVRGGTRSLTLPASLTNSTGQDRPPLSFAELLILNLDDIRRKTRATGWGARVYHSQMFTELWGPLPASDITSDMIETWAGSRRLSRADATVKFELSLLRRAFNLGIELGLLEKTPLTRSKVKLRPNKRHQVFTYEQEALLCSTFCEHAKNGEVLWLGEEFALLTGLRLGEQAHLRREHIQGDLLEVPEQGKTGKRLVPLCARAIVIAEFYNRLSLDCRSEWLFWPMRTNPDRNAMAENYVSKIFAPMCRMAGLYGLQRRDLRRTFATRLIGKGIPIFEVQALLGHTNPVQTMTYARVQIGQLRKSVSVLDQR